MTVSNRSNDIIWGTFGANAVHMSMLHEYVASALMLHVGKYTQISDSFHAYTAGSNRYNIQWNEVSDFLYNSFWAIPQGFIGPTLLEGISKPIQFLAFLEGIFFVTILGYLFFELLKLSIKSRILRLYILPYFFACFIIVFVSYPYLMFNVGSALRYKQSMHPILIFYPLLVLAYYRADNLMKNKIQKKIPTES